MEPGSNTNPTITKTQIIYQHSMKLIMLMAHMKLKTGFKILTTGKKATHHKVAPIGWDQESKVTAMEVTNKAIKIKVEKMLS